MNGSERVHVHRAVLAARSAFLRRVLTGEAANEPNATLNNGDANDVNVPLSVDEESDGAEVRSMRVQRRQEQWTLRVDAPHSELLALLRYMYTDAVDLADCNVEALKRVAREWQMPAVAKMCESVDDERVVIPSSTYLADMRGCINDAATADVSFEVDERVVRAHRAVLVHRCDYFKALLDGQFREASEGHVLVNDVEYNVFLAGLTYLYTGSIDAANAQLLFDLLYVSDFWHLDELKTQVEQLLLDFVDVETCCLFYEAALECRCSAEFRDAIMRFIRQKFGALLGADASEASVIELVHTRNAAAAAGDDPDANLATAKDPIEHGWVPRRDVDACKTCSRPFLYEPSEWPAALLTPLQELNKWHMAHRDAPTVAFHDVPDPAGVAHRIDAELRHVADVTKQRVRVRRSFRTKQLAKQNAALCALHQMHMI